MNELSTKAAPKLPCDIVAGAPATPPLRPPNASVRLLNRPINRPHIS